MILFIAYGKRTKPQGLVDMATFLRQRGHDVAVEHVWDDLRAIGRLPHDPSHVGVSVHTEIAGQLRQVINAIRRTWPKARLIIGGPHVNDDVLAKEPDFATLADWLVIGEGEYAMLDILDGCEPGVIRGELLSQQDFERLPMPSADEVQTLFAARPDAVLVNRGCPYSCSFCHAHRKRIVYRNPERVVRYFRDMQRQTGVGHWFILDDIFSANVSWLERFANAARGSGLTFRCFINGRLYDDRRHELLRKAGVNHASLGAESADDGVLALAGKGTTLADYERIEAMFRRTPGIDLHCLWMLGMPGDTPATTRQTLDAAGHIGQRQPNFGFATPYPGTQFYRTAAEHGSIIEPDWHKWTPTRISFLPHGMTLAGLRAAMKQAKAIKRETAA